MFVIEDVMGDHSRNVLPHSPFVSIAGTGDPPLNLNDLIHAVLPITSIEVIEDVAAPFVDVHTPEVEELIRHPVPEVQVFV